MSRIKVLASGGLSPSKQDDLLGNEGVGNSGEWNVILAFHRAASVTARIPHAM